MIDPRTGQPAPCPMCGSTDVRWRGRRWHDVPLTWTRAASELLFAGLFTGTRLRYRSAGEIAQTIRADKREARTAWRTPIAFWRCPECRNNGQVFGSPRRRGPKRRVEDRTRPPS